MKNDANHRLATALGWTNIVEVAGALLGTPPPGEPECRNQAAVPNWSGDWRECGPLIGQYRVTLNPSVSSNNYFAMTGSAGRGAFADTPLLAIVNAACLKLEASQ